MGRRLVVALSFANLCFLRTWRELLLGRPTSALATIKAPPAPYQYIAVLCAVSVLAGLFFMVALLARRAPSGVQAGLLFAAALLAGNAIRTILGNYFPVLTVGLLAVIGPRLSAVLIGLALAGAFGLVLWFHELCARTGSLLLLVFSPLVALTFGESLLEAVRYNPTPYADRPLAPRFQNPPPARVVWVIFDEWDYGLSFGGRPLALKLPELDRLRGDSLFATNALPPAAYTKLSIPALIYGREVSVADSLAPNRLALTFAGGGALNFGEGSNIFSQARELGVNTALAGWALPYCRVLNGALTSCWWQDVSTLLDADGDNLGEALAVQPRSLLETTVFSVFGQSLLIRQHARVYRQLLEQATAAATDPSMELCFLHFNIPHSPYFYDPGSGRFDRGNRLHGYADALALLDRTAGQLRAAMEKAGLWDRTTLLLTSDHWFRSSPAINGVRDERVPFILHLAGQKDPVTYSKQFNTVRTADLLLAILRAEVRTSADAVARLNQAGPPLAPVQP